MATVLPVSESRIFWREMVEQERGHRFWYEDVDSYFCFIKEFTVQREMWTQKGITPRKEVIPFLAPATGIEPVTTP